MCNVMAATFISVGLMMAGKKTGTFRVLCKIIDAKKATRRLPFIAYVVRGNVIFIFLVC